jgi:GT2 family glycosyltransferase
MLSQEQLNPEPAPQLSVIVPCYNSEATIRVCLDAILSQKTSVAFDVTVVDSSRDLTTEIVRTEYPEVRLIQLSDRTFAGAARNVGVKATCGGYCMMIDSDCIAAPDLVDRVVRRLSDESIAAVGGAICNGTPRSWSGLLCYLLEFKEFLPASPERTVTGMATANITYRRHVFEAMGGFDETMWLAEDILFNWKLTRAGHTILFDPEARVTHLNRTGWRNVLAYQYNMGRMSAIARRKGRLPGDSLLRYPALIGLAPLGRVARAAAWLFRFDRQLLLKFLAISPVYFIASSIWSAGFFQEAASQLANSQDAGK